MARLDSAILHEIVHVIQSREKVPERIRILKRQYQICYLEDHRQRMEEALRRRDFDRLNMLYGQLASKVKYQLIRAVASKSVGPKTVATKAARATGSRATPPKRTTKLATKTRPATKQRPKAVAKKQAAAKSARSRAR